MTYIIRKKTVFTHNTRIEGGKPQQRTLDGFVNIEGTAMPAVFNSVDDAKHAMNLQALTGENDAGYKISYHYAIYEDYNVHEGNGTRPTSFLSEPEAARNWA